MGIAEYGLGSEVSTYGDVYSYGVLLLEMFTGKRPTDDMFKEGLNLHKFAESALPNRVNEIVDPILFQESHSDKPPAIIPTITLTLLFSDLLKLHAGS